MCNGGAGDDFLPHFAGLSSPPESELASDWPHEALASLSVLTTRTTELLEGLLDLEERLLYLEEGLLDLDLELLLERLSSSLSILVFEQF